MNNYASRWEKDNREFASKKLGLFIYTPCWIAIGTGCLHIAMGMTPEAGPYIVMGSLLALVCSSLGQLRAKIIQQNQIIQILQEKLDEIDSSPDRDS